MNPKVLVMLVRKCDQIVRENVLSPGREAGAMATLLAKTLEGIGPDEVRQAVNGYVEWADYNQ